MNTEANERLTDLNALIEATEQDSVREALKMIVQLVIDSAYNPVREARGVMRNELKKDPDLLRVYHDNVACWIMDFEARRSCEPMVEVGPMSKNQRDQLAGIILKNLFDL